MNAIATTPSVPASPDDNALKEIVPSPLRADLIMQRQLFRGNQYYVIKDPLALTYFRLQLEEGYLITLLDGKRNLDEIHRLFQAQFPNKDLGLQEIAAFNNQMSLAGLLNINARRFVSVAKAQQSLPAGWLMLSGKMLGSLLFMQIPLLDPSGWLPRLTRSIRFVWTKWFVGLCLAFITWTIFWLVVNRDAFTQNTIDFFSPENFFLIWVTIIFVKTLHEFGHATTCSRFGGEVHEMGVCLICFAPAGYVDASDAWMMRNKAHKLYTTIAGIFVEFVVAAIAAHLWLHLPPGLAKNLAFNAMMVASVNTLFFNANPLMKFDGYYVVSDWLEIPNLRAKAMMYCSYHVQRWLLGYRNISQERVLQDEQHSRVFIIYSVLAYTYMLTVIYSLSQVFARILGPYGLHDFGLALGFFMQGSFLMFPILKVMTDAFTAGRTNMVREENAWRRIFKWLMPTALILGIVAILPSRFRVEQQAVLVASRGERAGVEVGGTVKKVHVRAGQIVEKGQTILTLENAEVQNDVTVAELTLESARLRLTSLQSDGKLRSTSLAPEAAMLVESAATQRDRALRAREQLEVRAPTRGSVATPDIERLGGRYLPAGFSGIRVADLREFKLMIPLTESQAELVEAGSRVKGFARANGMSVTGTVVVLPNQKATWDDYLPAMLSAFGGPAPFEPKAAADLSAPTFGLFVAEASISGSITDGIEGMRFKVTIEGKRSTYGKRFWRWLEGWISSQSAH